jgi:hypothetical protein
MLTFMCDLCNRLLLCPVADYIIYVVPLTPPLPRCRPMGPNLTWGKCAGPMPSNYEPNPKVAAHHMHMTEWKIWAAAKLLG